MPTPTLQQVATKQATDEANITSLTTRVTQDEARIVALEAAVAVLQKPIPSPPPAPVPPPAPLFVESKDGDQVPPLTQLVDAKGHKWTIASSGKIAVDGSTDNATDSVVLLYYKNHTVYQSAYSLWWSWNGTSWNTDTDPRTVTAPPPAPLPAGKVPYLLGAYAPSMAQAQSDMGRPIDFTIGYAGYNSINDIAAGQYGNFPASPERVVWDIYTMPIGGSMSDAASGAYDWAYAQAAQYFATKKDQIVAMRVNSEFNGSWSAYHIGVNGSSNQDWINAYRRLAAQFRKYAPSIKLDWNSGIGQVDPRVVYPGDDVVDIIGMDVYMSNAYFGGQDPTTRWNHILNGDGAYGSSGWGLNAMAQFAGLHNKPMSFPEWGSDFDDGQDIVNMAAWINSHNVVYHSYWDSNDGGAPDALSAHPNIMAAFKAAWGGTSYGGTYF